MAFEVSPIADWPGDDAWMAEPTSVALRRERDELKAALARRAKERDEWIKAHDRVVMTCAKVDAELVSARTELDALRTARDNLERELGEARKQAKELARALASADTHIAQLERPTATSEPSLTWPAPPTQTEGAPTE